MKLKSLAAAVTALLVPMAVWAAGPVSVSIVPAVQNVAQGGNVTATVRIDGLLGVPDQLSAYDLRVTYNTGLLTFVSQSFLADAFMGSGSELESFSVAAGVATDIVDSFFTLPADLVTAQAGVNGFDLFSLTFTAANVDAFTNLAFSIVPNISPFVIGNNNANVLAANYTGACISIGAGECGGVTTPVPEPGTFAMMAAGLLAAGAFSRARRRSKEGTAAA